MMDTAIPAPSAYIDINLSYSPSFKQWVIQMNYPGTTTKTFDTLDAALAAIPEIIKGH